MPVEHPVASSGAYATTQAPLASQRNPGAQSVMDAHEVPQRVPLQTYGVQLTSVALAVSRVTASVQLSPVRSWQLPLLAQVYGRPQSSSSVQPVGHPRPSPSQT
jgi:hypothetical protein